MVGKFRWLLCTLTAISKVTLCHMQIVFSAIWHVAEASAFHLVEFLGLMNSHKEMHAPCICNGDMYLSFFDPSTHHLMIAETPLPRVVHESSHIFFWVFIFYIYKLILVGKGIANCCCCVIVYLRIKSLVSIDSLLRVHAVGYCSDGNDGGMGLLVDL